MCPGVSPTVTVGCPSCGSVRVFADMFIGHGVPVGGSCPKCFRRLTWDPEAVYLAGFSPAGMSGTATEPTFQMTITAQPGDPL